MELKDTIRNIQDFPIEGILFHDITTLLINPVALKETIDRFTERYKDEKIDVVVGMESRGFIFATPLAIQLGCGFVPVRKPGKLPSEIEFEEYTLEYGTDRLEIHKDAVSPGVRVLIIDDLLATGGTAAATCRLIEKLGGDIVGCAFLVELDDLKGREKLGDHDIFTIIHY